MTVETEASRTVAGITTSERRDAMKLDRNVNSDGRGKYALINLRSNKVQWGWESPGDQFFVIKYKDRFARFALAAYADAVSDFARTVCPESLRAELEEYASEIRAEAKLAADLDESGDTQIPD